MDALVDFIKFITDMLEMLISMVGMALSVFTSLFAMVPPEISVPAGVLLAVCIIYKILGRENQS